jgi:hypothetical protein
MVLLGAGCVLRLAQTACLMKRESEWSGWLYASKKIGVECQANTGTADRGTSTGIKKESGHIEVRSVGRIVARIVTRGCCGGFDC